MAWAIAFGGAVTLAYWVARALDHGLNDTGRETSEPPLAIFQVGGFAFIAGLGVVMSCYFSHAARRHFVIGAGVVAAVAVAIPLALTWRVMWDRHAFAALGKRLGTTWSGDPSSYTEDGDQVEARFVARYLRRGDVPAESVLAYYEQRLERDA